MFSHVDITGRREVLRFQSGERLSRESHGGYVEGLSVAGVQVSNMFDTWSIATHRRFSVCIAVV